MTVDDKVISFLKQNKGKLFCDACIALCIPRPGGGHINNVQASNATRPLKEAGGFFVASGECSKCGEYRQKVTKKIL